MDLDCIPVHEHAKIFSHLDIMLDKNEVQPLLILILRKKEDSR